MAVYYFDSSVLVKYYMVEPGTSWVRQLVNADENSFLICDIAIVEVAAAIAQMQRDRMFGKSLMRATIGHFQRDITEGLFLSHSIGDDTLQSGARLAMQYPLKGYDAVQIASGMLLAQRMADVEFIFVSGDKKMLKAAESKGLRIDNPFNHIDEDAPFP